MSFFKSKQSLTDQAVTAVDRITGEVMDLHDQREDVLGCFRCTAERLSELNAELSEKTALCGVLIAQLTQAQENISQQVQDNEKVRGKILDIIGE